MNSNTTTPSNTSSNTANAAANSSGNNNPTTPNTLSTSNSNNSPIENIIADLVRSIVATRSGYTQLNNVLEETSLVVEIVSSSP